MRDEKRQNKRRELACRLRDLGVPLETPQPDGEPGLIIRQQGGLTENRAFDLSCGGTGFMIDLFLLFNKFRTAVAYFSLEVPWQDSSFRWLDDPVEIDAPWNVYRFPGTNALEFPRELVMNRVAGLSRMWSQGEFVKGLLLGFGSKSIPDNFRHGSLIPAFITVVDQFETPFSSSISLWTDRSARFSRYLRNKPRQRLFEHADVEASPLRACELKSEKVK